jgi:hypothetical protein
MQLSISTSFKFILDNTITIAIYYYSKMPLFEHITDAKKNGAG